MMHTVFIPVLILLHVSAMMVLGRVLHGKSLTGWFVFFNDVYFMFCGFSGYTDADFLLSIHMEPPLWKMGCQSCHHDSFLLACTLASSNGTGNR